MLAEKNILKINHKTASDQLNAVTLCYQFWDTLRELNQNTFYFSAVTNQTVLNHVLSQASS